MFDDWMDDLVEVGGVEPPSNGLDQRYTTGLVGV
jgi:hypothetical protein